MVLDQKGCLYTPQILAIQTGQKLMVKNSDTCIHNVHCTPTVAGNPESNQVQMPGGAGPDLHLSQAGNVHDVQMRRASVDVRLGERV